MLLDHRLISSKLFLNHIDTTPNVDYFTREELRKIVRDFKQKIASGEDNEVSLEFLVAHEEV